MKTFEVQTPILKRAIGAFDDVINGVVDGDEARNRIGAGTGLVRTVGQELKVRLAMPKLVAIDAKLAAVEAAS